MNKSSFAIDTDELTLASARKGDIKAMERIYRTYSSPVYSLALGICSSCSDAEDITQDTFIEVFKKLNQFRGEAPFWAWLRRIAVNTSLMRLRREKHLSVLFDDEIAHLETVATDSQAANQHDLENALNKLSPTARSVILLHDVEGYTHNEIGEMMGKSPSFSKSQLSRAHKKLRSRLQWKITNQTSTQTTQSC